MNMLRRLVFAAACIGAASPLLAQETTVRIGIARGTDPVKIEDALMKAVPRASWHALGMSLTHLGRELCRPTDPDCPACPVNKACAYAVSNNAERPKKPKSR